MTPHIVEVYNTPLLQVALCFFKFQSGTLRLTQQPKVSIFYLINPKVEANYIHLLMLHRLVSIHDQNISMINFFI